MLLTVVSLTHELLSMHKQDGWAEADGKEMKLAMYDESARYLKLATCLFCRHGSKKPHPLEKSAKVQSAKLALGERFGFGQVVCAFSDAFLLGWLANQLAMRYRSSPSI